MNHSDHFAPPDEVIRAQREALIIAARSEQQRKKAGTARLHFLSRLLSYAGKILIRLGNRLENRDPIHPSPFNITPHP